MVPATHQLIANLEDVVNFLLGGGFNPFEKILVKLNHLPR